ncbi:hypothetical protein B0T17DRAFT_341716 [Bombardia bombarda]|uniref:Zinc finger C2H2 LYAR-type domain-containing protein n=1 Tax=Bombardia bombarda TaxID=252184 RepID=A0AA39WN77_9PEZI|nr:hypothetical protein B0T17DRAFT_341716 [Bombardia bombarda]
MVSFSCESCGDIFTKKKLDPHRNRCRGATFTCIDCMVHFPGTEYRNHTSCMSEDQKYQGALYRNKKAKTAPFGNNTPAAAPPPAMAQPAYVEDVAEEYESWRKYENNSDDDDRSPVDHLPEAPTPPSAVEEPVNVFDFLVANATPTASHVSLPTITPAAQQNEETQLVRFDREALLDAEDSMDDDAMVQYGSGPVPVSNFETPAPKSMRKKLRDAEKDARKSDKKRKRLHVETDQVMTDAPPVMHSGLTGGLNRMMSRPAVFPPSPDYSGGDVAETPASPLKKSKSKHSKSSKTDSIGNSLMAMIASGSKTKTKKTKRTTTTSSGSIKKKSRKRLEAPKEQKLLEYTPGSKDVKQGSGEMVIFKPRAEHFLSFVNKGPESERGCSMNKALKRFHRERNGSSSTSVSKLMEEKELWRSLRMKRNERGEIVLFCV